MRRAAYWLMPALLAVALFAITIPGTFTYDDVYTCKEDPRLKPPSEWRKYFYQGYFPDGADNLWRPLVSLTYAFQTWAHGPRAWAFHLVNVILHGISTALVTLLAARLAGKRIGLLAGLFFAVHPVHVEAVAGIVGRAEEMALIGIVWALLLFIDRPMTRGRAVGIVACFLFAAGCKEQGLLIPPMLLAWWLLRRRRIAQPQTGGATEHFQLDYAGPMSKGEYSDASRVLVALMTLTMAAYIGYRNHILPWFWEKGFLDPALNPLAIAHGYDRWLIPVAILGRYVELLFVPTHFSLDRSIRNVPELYRAARLGFFREVVQTNRLQGIILGHHRDDQAETVFQSLVHGSGPMGLRGIQSISKLPDLTVLHPMLNISRAALRQVLIDRQITWREDASNALPISMRNRVRQVLATAPELTEAMLDLCEASRRLCQTLSLVAPRLQERFNVAVLRGFPPPLARHALRRWLIQNHGDRKAINTDALNRLIAMVEDAASPAHQVFPGGLSVRRRSGEIFIDPSPRRP